jgi:hypothetical protein
MLTRSQSLRLQTLHRVADGGPDGLGGDAEDGDHNGQHIGAGEYPEA